MTFFTFLILLTATGAACYLIVKEILRKKNSAKTSSAAKPLHPVAIWIYADKKMAPFWLEAVERLRGFIPQKLNLKIFSTRHELDYALSQAAEKDRLPDVFQADYEQLDPLASAGKLLLTKFMDMDAFEWQSEILTPFVRKDAVFAFPTEYSLCVLYYNRQLFDRVKVPYPGTHWTWETLLEHGPKLFRPPQEPGGIIYALEQPLTLEWWNALSSQSGHGLYENKTWALGQPEHHAHHLASLQFLAELYQNHTYCAPSTAEGSPSYFEQGKSVMLIAGPEKRLPLQLDPHLQWGVCLLPRKTNTVTPLLIRALAIAGNTKEPETARIVVKSLRDLVSSGWLPARHPKETEMTNEYTTIYKVSLRYAVPGFPHTKIRHIQQTVAEALHALRLPTPIQPERFITELQAKLPLLSPLAQTSGAP